MLLGGVASVTRPPRPSSEVLDLQGVQGAFPLANVGSGSEPTEPDQRGNDPSEDIFRSSDKETLASPAVSTHRVGSSSEAPCPAVQNEPLGDENDVPTGCHQARVDFNISCRMWRCAGISHRCMRVPFSVLALLSGSLSRGFRVSGFLGSCRPHTTPSLS